MPESDVPAGQPVTVESVTHLTTMLVLASLLDSERPLLTRAGLCWVRAALDPATTTLPPGEGLDKLRARCTELLGLQPGDSPDFDPIPDTIPPDWC